LRDFYQDADVTAQVLYQERPGFVNRFETEGSGFQQFANIDLPLA
jgi:hypothetical protein